MRKVKSVPAYGLVRGDGMTDLLDGNHLESEMQETKLPFGPNTLLGMATIMDEAASMLRKLPPDVCDQLNIRHFLCDELEGSSMMLRDNLPAPPNNQVERPGNPVRSDA